MSWLGGLYNFPIVDFKKLSIFRENLSNWVVKYEAGSKRNEGAVNVYRVWVSREVHGVDSQIREMSLNPIDSG